MLRFAGINEIEDEEENDDVVQESIELRESRVRSKYERALGEMDRVHPSAADDDIIGAYSHVVALFEELLKDPLFETNEFRKSAAMQQIKYLSLKNLGLVHEKRKSPLEAAKYYAEAVVEDGNDVTLWCKLGDLLRQQEMHHAAKCVYEFGLLCDQEFWPCLEGLALVLDQTGDSATCERVLEIAKSKNYCLNVRPKKPRISNPAAGEMVSGGICRIDGDDVIMVDDDEGEDRNITNEGTCTPETLPIEIRDIGAYFGVSNKHRSMQGAWRQVGLSLLKHLQQMANSGRDLSVPIQIELKNATEHDDHEDMCHDCGDDSTDQSQSIQCDTCFRSFHFNCAGLANKSDRPKGREAWECKYCKGLGDKSTMIGSRVEDSKSQLKLKRKEIQRKNRSAGRRDVALGSYLRELIGLDENEGGIDDDNVADPLDLVAIDDWLGQTSSKAVRDQYREKQGPTEGALLHSCSCVLSLQSLSSLSAEETCLIFTNGISPCGNYQHFLSAVHTLLMQHCSRAGEHGYQTIFNRFPHFPNVATLDLSHCKLGIRGCSGLAENLHHLSRLSTLLLENCKIGPKGMVSLKEPLATLTNLTVLNMKNNFLGNAGISMLCEKLPVVGTQLVDLNLEYNNFEQEGAQTLAEHLVRCSLLTGLSLGFNNIGFNGIRVLAPALATLSSINRLSLQCNIGAKGVPFLVNCLSSLFNLGFLDISHNSIGSEAPASSIIASALTHMTSLVHLDLGFNALGNEGLANVSQALCKMSQLQFLSVEGNDFSSKVVPHFCNGFPFLKKLQVLRLGHNPELSNDNGAHHIWANMPRLPHLREFCAEGMSLLGFRCVHLLGECLPFFVEMETINLRSCHVNNESIKVLLDGSKSNTNLRRLILGKNDIGDEGAHTIAGYLRFFTNLEVLDLSENNLSDNGAGALAKQLHQLQKLKILDVGGNHLGLQGIHALTTCCLQSIPFVQRIETQGNPVLSNTDLIRGSQDWPEIGSFVQWHRSGRNCGIMHVLHHWLNCACELALSYAAGPALSSLLLQVHEMVKHVAPFKPAVYVCISELLVDKFRLERHRRSQVLLQQQQQQMQMQSPLTQVTQQHQQQQQQLALSLQHPKPIPWCDVFSKVFNSIPFNSLFSSSGSSTLSPTSQRSLINDGSSSTGEDLKWCVRVFWLRAALMEESDNKTAAIQELSKCKKILNLMSRSASGIAVQPDVIAASFKTSPVINMDLVQRRMDHLRSRNTCIVAQDLKMHGQYRELLSFLRPIIFRRKFSSSSLSDEEKISLFDHVATAAAKVGDVNSGMIAVLVMLRHTLTCYETDKTNGRMEKKKKILTELSLLHELAKHCKSDEQQQQQQQQGTEAMPNFSNYWHETSESLVGEASTLQRNNSFSSVTSANSIQDFRIPKLVLGEAIRALEAFFRSLSPSQMEIHEVIKHMDCIFSLSGAFGDTSTLAGMAKRIKFFRAFHVELGKSDWCQMLNCKFLDDYRKLLWAAFKMEQQLPSSSSSSSASAASSQFMNVVWLTNLCENMDDEDSVAIPSVSSSNLNASSSGGGDDDELCQIPCAEERALGIDLAGELAMCFRCCYGIEFTKSMFQAIGMYESENHKRSKPRTMTIDAAIEIAEFVQLLVSRIFSNRKFAKWDFWLKLLELAHNLVHSTSCKFKATEYGRRALDFLDEDRVCINAIASANELFPEPPSELLALISREPAADASADAEMTDAQNVDSASQHHYAPNTMNLKLRNSIDMMHKLFIQIVQWENTVKRDFPDVAELMRAFELSTQLPTKSEKLWGWKVLAAGLRKHLLHCLRYQRLTASNDVVMHSQCLRAYRVILSLDPTDCCSKYWLAVIVYLRTQGNGTNKSSTEVQSLYSLSYQMLSEALADPSLKPSLVWSGHMLLGKLARKMWKQPGEVLGHLYDSLCASSDMKNRKNEVVVALYELHASKIKLILRGCTDEQILQKYSLQETMERANLSPKGDWEHEQTTMQLEDADARVALTDAVEAMKEIGRQLPNWQKPVFRLAKMMHSMKKISNVQAIDMISPFFTSTKSTEGMSLNMSNNEIEPIYSFNRLVPNYISLYRVLLEATLNIDRLQKLLELTTRLTHERKELMKPALSKLPEAVFKVLKTMMDGNKGSDNKENKRKVFMECVRFWQLIDKPYKSLDIGYSKERVTSLVVDAWLEYEGLTRNKNITEVLWFNRALETAKNMKKSGKVGTAEESSSSNAITDTINMIGDAGQNVNDEGQNMNDVEMVEESNKGGEESNKIDDSGEVVEESNKGGEESNEIDDNSGEVVEESNKIDDSGEVVEESNKGDEEINKIDVEMVEESKGDEESNEIDDNSGEVVEESNKIDDSGEVVEESNKIDDNSGEIVEESNKGDEESNKGDEESNKGDEESNKIDDSGEVVEESNKGDEESNKIDDSGEVVEESNKGGEESNKIDVEMVEESNKEDEESNKIDEESNRIDDNSGEIVEESNSVDDNDVVMVEASNKEEEEEEIHSEPTNKDKKMDDSDSDVEHVVEINNGDIPGKGLDYVVDVEDYQSDDDKNIKPFSPLPKAENTVEPPHTPSPQEQSMDANMEDANNRGSPLAIADDQIVDVLDSDEDQVQEKQASTTAVFLTARPLLPAGTAVPSPTSSSSSVRSSSSGLPSSINPSTIWPQILQAPPNDVTLIRHLCMTMPNAAQSWTVLINSVPGGESEFAMNLVDMVLQRNTTEKQQWVLFLVNRVLSEVDAFPRFLCAHSQAMLPAKLVALVGDNNIDVSSCAISIIRILTSKVDSFCKYVVSDSGHFATTLCRLLESGNDGNDSMKGGVASIISHLVNKVEMFATQMASHIPSLAKSLSELLTCPSNMTKGNAARAINNLTKKVPDFGKSIVELDRQLNAKLVALLTNESEVARGNAAWVIGSLVSKVPAFGNSLTTCDPDFAKKLANLLKCPTDSVRGNVAWAIGNLAAKVDNFGKAIIVGSSSFPSDLSVLLCSSNDVTKANAVLAISTLALKSNDFAVTMVKADPDLARKIAVMLYSDSDISRGHAVAAIANLSKVNEFATLLMEAEKELASHLVKLLLKSSDITKTNAAGAIAVLLAQVSCFREKLGNQVETTSHEIEKQLILMLTSPSMVAVGNAAIAIGRITAAVPGFGPSIIKTDKQILGKLVTYLRGNNDWLRANVAVALGALVGEVENARDEVLKMCPELQTLLSENNFNEPIIQKAVEIVRRKEKYLPIAIDDRVDLTSENSNSTDTNDVAADSNDNMAAGPAQVTSSSSASASKEVDVIVID